jgi:hypothetical protein
MTTQKIPAAPYLFSRIVHGRQDINDREQKLKELIKGLLVRDGLIRTQKNIEIIQAHLKHLSQGYEALHAVIESFMNPYKGWDLSTFTDPFFDSLSSQDEELKQKLQEIEAKYEEKYKGNLEDPIRPIFKAIDENIVSFYINSSY